MNTERSRESEIAASGSVRMPREIHVYQTLKKNENEVRIVSVVYVLIICI